MQDDYELETHKICLLGITGVGKSQLVNRKCSDEFIATEQPTIGCEFKTSTQILADKKIKLQIWDTAGQERYFSLLPMYMKENTVIIICFALNNMASFESVDRFIEQAKKNQPEAKLILVGTKSDLTKQLCVSQSDIDAKVQQHGIDHYEATSAKDNKNVSKLFNKVAEMCLTAPNVTYKLDPDAAQKAVQLILGNIKNELRNPNSSIRTHGLTTASVKDDLKNKQRVYKGVQKIHVLCQRAINEHDSLSYEQALRKIHCVIYDKELRLGNSRWDRFLLWIRRVLDKIGLGVKPDQREKLNTLFQDVLKKIPSEFRARISNQPTSP